MPTTRMRAPGELEGQVMRILWTTDTPLSATQIQAAFEAPAPAYATVMTALDRLEKKGQVSRSGDSPRKVRFEAVQAEHEQASATMISALDGASDRQAVLLRFAGNLEAGDVKLLREAIGATKSRARRA